MTSHRVVEHGRPELDVPGRHASSSDQVRRRLEAIPHHDVFWFVWSTFVEGRGLITGGR